MNEEQRSKFFVFHAGIARGNPAAAQAPGNARLPVADAGLPPMCTMLRPGCKNPGSPMWCRSSLLARAYSMMRTISSSPSSVHRHPQVVLAQRNRQVRILPSLVSRMREQAPQKGRLTGAITPNSAPPSSNT